MSTSDSTDIPREPTRCPGCAGRGYVEVAEPHRPCAHCNGTGVMLPDGEPPQAISESPPG